MIKINDLILGLSVLIFLVSSPVKGQDYLQSELVDLKMNLAETKLDLLDSKIRLWEDKPANLERKLQDIENRMGQLTFSPDEFNEKFLMLDSLLENQQSLLEEKKNPVSVFTEIPPEPIVIPPAKYVISMFPVKLFEGTLQLSIERIINQGNSIELSGMATYANKEGLANFYLENQKLNYYSAALSDYVPYNSENLSGYGGSLQWKNYLFPRTNPRYRAPGGLYAAPDLMYRRVFLNGFDRIYNEEDEIWEEVEITQRLHIFSGGFYVGWQFILWNSITADVYTGGMIRLSKYDGEEKFTRYKKLSNIDFSGVMPGFGIKLGIL